MFNILQCQWLEKVACSDDTLLRSFSSFGGFASFTFYILYILSRLLSCFKLFDNYD